MTGISLYWFSDSLVGSLRLYKDNRLHPFTFGAGEQVKPPLGVSRFPKEIAMPPRSWLERVFDVRRWNEMPAGGHFAALEKPDQLAAELRSFYRPFRWMALRWITLHCLGRTIRPV